MSYETIIWEVSDGLGRLTLNRPDSLNAWTIPFGEEMKAVIEGEAADPSVRAVLITGAGRGFSSGADLKEGFIAADDGFPDILKALHDYYHPILVGVRRLEKPVIAAVNGPAVGIGCSLALACDLVLAAESAFLGLAFVNIGLMPDGGSTLFVPARWARPAPSRWLCSVSGSRRTRRSIGGWSTTSTPTTSSWTRPRPWRPGWPRGRPGRTPRPAKHILNQSIYPDLDAQLELEESPARARAHPGLRRGCHGLPDQARPRVSGT